MINEHDYKNVSVSLNQTTMTKLQPYTTYDLPLIKSELDLAITFQNQFNEKKYKEYITNYKAGVFNDVHLVTFAKENYRNAVLELVNASDYKEKLALDSLINYELLPKSTQEIIINEMTMATAIDNYYKNNLDQVVIATVYHEGEGDELDAIYQLANVIKNERAGDVRMAMHYLLAIPVSVKLPSPFNEELNRLMNKYEGTKEYALTKEFIENRKTQKTSRPEIGMTAEQVREIWGVPKKINRTETVYGISEQWVYYSDKYVYLKNGYVTAIQD